MTIHCGKEGEGGGVRGAWEHTHRLPTDDFCFFFFVCFFNPQQNPCLIEITVKVNRFGTILHIVS